MSTLTVRSLLLLASACHLVRASAILKNIGIYGGHRINITQVPSFAKFCTKDEDLNYCGANIVHERFLVTAAHCFTTVNDLKQFRVVVGTDVNKRGHGQHYELENVFIHPNYFENQSENYYSIDNDMAVIKLTKNLAFNARVKPIKMADADTVLKNGDVLEAVGFGMTEHHQQSKYLLAVNVNLFDHKKCGEIYQKQNVSLTDRFICTLGEPGKGTCNGDSGGPLIFNETLVGVTSYAIGCVSGGFPEAFTSIRALRSFIDDTIKNNL